MAPFRYPEGGADRTQWILARRPARNERDPYQPYDFCLERERSESGALASVATIFLTNRECPWRCLMCDLWRNTLTETVPLGAIPAQIDFAFERLLGAQPASVTQIKLYNSGSFFDPQAIPVADYEAIADRVRVFERVIVESHPALVGADCLHFRDLLAGQLEVAMGLETVHPEVLEKLNKRTSLEQFASAAAFLRKHKIALRVFVLVKPPFLNETEALDWAKRSLDCAFDHGATVASLIPTRGGNGAMEALADLGEFAPPKLATLERAATYGINAGRGRVFADLWDLERFSECNDCFAARADRLRKMNLTQESLPAVRCSRCGGSGERDV